jgi:hypothetical protein
MVSLALALASHLLLLLLMLPIRFANCLLLAVALIQSALLIIFLVMYM